MIIGPSYFWKLILISTDLKAGLCNIEMKFDSWEWEEELTVLNLEHVGLGNYGKLYQLMITEVLLFF